MQKQWISSSVSETFKIAKEVGSLITTRTIQPWIFLIGDIGSGKTTFVRGVFSFWGEEDMVSSPTFSLIHHYPHPTFSLYHVDLYRIHSFEEIEEMGVIDLFREENIVFVEWPTLLLKKDQTLTIHCTQIHFAYGANEASRIISLFCENR